MVAGDQQAAFGLVEGDVRGRVAGSLDYLPGAKVGLNLHARKQIARRFDDPREAGATALGLLGVSAQRLLRNAAKNRHFNAPLERSLGIGRGLNAVLVVGVHPQLAAGRLDDRGRLAVVVGVRVGTDEQAN